MIKRLVLELDEELHRQIKEKAIKLGRPMKYIFLELLEKWLTTNAKKTHPR